MPIVHVEMKEGRTKEQKASIVRNVTQAMVDSTGCSHERVMVVIREVSPFDLGVGGITVAEKQGLE